MAEKSRRQFALEELTALFAALERIDRPCVLMGGQAVCYWASRYLPTEPVLQEFARLSAFVSKDIDFQGGLEAARVFARAMGCKLQAPSFREAFGNLMSGKFSLGVGPDSLSVEVLRKVPGLSQNETIKFASLEGFGDLTVRVLNPIALLKAKSWNVVNITKAGRHDLEQLLALVVCVRTYLTVLLQFSGKEHTRLRGTLNLIEQLLRFTELPEGRKTAEKCGVDWSQILPHAYIAASAQPELIRLRQIRVPDWLGRIARYKRAKPASETQLRMLEILAQHAEPWCAQPAPRRSSRNPQPATRRP